MSIVEQLLAAYKEYQDDPKTLFIELKAVLDATLKPIEESIKKLTTERDACKKELDNLNGLDLDFDQKKVEIEDILNKANIIANSKIAPRGVQEQFNALRNEHTLALENLEAEITAAKATTAAKKTALEAKLAELDKKIQEANDEIKCYNDEYKKFIKDHKVTEYTAEALTERTKSIYLALSSKELGMMSIIASSIQIKKDKNKWSYIVDSAKKTKFKPGFLSDVEFKASAKDDVADGFTLTLDWVLSYSKQEMEITSNSSIIETIGKEKTIGHERNFGKNAAIGISEDTGVNIERNAEISHSVVEGTHQSSSWSLQERVQGSPGWLTKFLVDGEAEITNNNALESGSHRDVENGFAHGITHGASKNTGLQLSADVSSGTVNSVELTDKQETSKGKENGTRQMFSFEGMKETFTMQYIFETKENGVLECKRISQYETTSVVKNIKINYILSDEKFIRS